MLNSLSLTQLVEITKGRLIQGDEHRSIEQISIDSRQVFNPSKTLFIALQGAKAKGETFIPSLIELGVEVFLVPLESAEKLAASFESQAFLAVPDTRKALQEIAKYTREQFKSPVVGITGSNGKTIVK